MANLSKLSADQLRKIKTLTKGMDDATYRGMLRDRYSVDSATALTFAQAHDLLQGLTRHEQSSEQQKKKYAHLNGRTGMANGAQLRMVEAMWKDVSHLKEPIKRAAALKEFLKSRFNIINIEWMEAQQVNKVVRALKAMLWQRRKAMAGRPTETAVTP